MFRLVLYIIQLLMPSFIPTVVRYILLVWRLTFDKRVSRFLRVLVPLAIVYFIVPFGLVPDWVAPFGLAKADDFIILGMAILLLIKLAPSYVVAEHLGKTPPSDDLEDKDSSKVVDGKARFPKDD